MLVENALTLYLMLVRILEVTDVFPGWAKCLCHRGPQLGLF